MIKRVTLKNFKCFKEQAFDLDDTLVLAGPNNSGKTTLLQAMAVWQFAWREWQMIQRGGSKAKKQTGVAIARQAFLATPVRALSLLWHNTSTALGSSEGAAGAPRPMSITLEGETPPSNSGDNADKDEQGPATEWELSMEFRYSNPELVYAKPSGATPPKGLGELIVHVPSFSGISAEEPVHTPAHQDWLIGQGRPGDTLRNLLVEINRESKQWERLNEDIQDIFGHTLEPPQHNGLPFILCDYRPGTLPTRGRGRLPKLDIATAGRGFLQTLMLLAFFYARPATILLVDEPDVHSHVMLQRQLYDHLRELAKQRKCQLVMATHSEVLINKTEPNKIISFYGRPHLLVRNTERNKVREALKRLSSMDIALSEKKQILYVEGESDFSLLKAWAKALEHPAYEWFNDKNAHCYPMRGYKPEEVSDHFFALHAVQKDMLGITVFDRDGDDKRHNKHGTRRHGLYVHVWQRYEIENYLVHPDAIRRFVSSDLGPLFGELVHENIRNALPLFVFKNPLAAHNYLKRTAARKELFPQFMADTDIGKDKYHLIAAQMQPHEIHPDIKEFLDEFAKIMGVA